MSSIFDTVLFLWYVALCVFMTHVHSKNCELWCNFLFISFCKNWVASLPCIVYACVRVLQMACWSSPPVCPQRFIHISLHSQVAFVRGLKTFPDIQYTWMRSIVALKAHFSWCPLRQNDGMRHLSRESASSSVNLRHAWLPPLLLLSYFDWYMCKFTMMDYEARLLPLAMNEVLRITAELSHRYLDMPYLNPSIQS